MMKVILLCIDILYQMINPSSGKCSYVHIDRFVAVISSGTSS
jgi:hypothetical protein